MRQNKAIPVLGITGGVGAGKSAVLSYLSEKYGAFLLVADEIAADLEKPGTDCFAQIQTAFGEGILLADGNLDRQKLGDIIFTDPQKREILDSIVHPEVKKAILEAIQKRQASGDVPLIVIEAALLIEDHYDRICDEIWYVCADEQTRAARLKRARGYSDQKIRLIMQSQLSEAEFRARCDLTLDNSGDASSVRSQIDEALLNRGFFAKRV